MWFKCCLMLYLCIISTYAVDTLSIIPKTGDKKSISAPTNDSSTAKSDIWHNNYTDPLLVERFNVGTIPVLPEGTFFLLGHNDLLIIKKKFGDRFQVALSGGTYNVDTICAPYSFIDSVTAEEIETFEDSRGFSASMIYNRYFNSWSLNHQSRQVFDLEDDIFHVDSLRDNQYYWDRQYSRKPSDWLNWSHVKAIADFSPVEGHNFTLSFKPFLMSYTDDVLYRLYEAQYDGYRENFYLQNPLDILFSSMIINQGFNLSLSWQKRMGDDLTFFLQIPFSHRRIRIDDSEITLREFTYTDYDNDSYYIEIMDTTQRTTEFDPEFNKTISSGGIAAGLLRRESRRYRWPMIILPFIGQYSNALVSIRNEYEMYNVYRDDEYTMPLFLRLHYESYQHISFGDFFNGPRTYTRADAEVTFRNGVQALQLEGEVVPTFWFKKHFFFTPFHFEITLRLEEDHTDIYFQGDDDMFRFGMDFTFAKWGVRGSVAPLNISVNDVWFNSVQLQLYRKW